MTKQEALKILKKVNAVCSTNTDCIDCPFMVVSMTDVCPFDVMPGLTFKSMSPKEDV